MQSASIVSTLVEAFTVEIVRANYEKFVAVPTIASGNVKFFVKIVDAQSPRAGCTYAQSDCRLRESIWKGGSKRVDGNLCG